MKTLKKVLKWTGLTILFVLIIVFITVQLRWNRTFEAPLPDIHASTDSAVIAHGEYLVYGPSHCAECHISKEDYPRVLMGEKVPLSGGFDFILPFGTVYTKNLTSDKETGIGGFTDPEIARVLRYGVRTDGHALINFMNFYELSDEDVTAIISYLRTLEPAKKEVKDNEWNFLGKVLLSFVIKPSGSLDPPRPASVHPDTTAVYGKYLANSVSNCLGCHTNRDMKTGKYIGEPFSGGFKMESATGDPNVFCVTPNLTPDEKTGHIYTWTQQDFIKRFRDGKLIMESPMPWGPYKNFSDNDLKAIYAYLKSLPAVENVTGPVKIVEN